ncbi:MAG TPA: saccharopine dehydrogenase NADP-binding domain-containing protein [Burkholderiaceae bacterium]|nr:saccharopine dehydrogenase NADP-binding domain-containing protein [Burkholderiaceae bacterium]
MARSTARPFDVVLYGATGFVGRQTARYFATHAPAPLRWAVAGRSQAKLDALRLRLGEARPGVIVADAADAEALAALAAQARVVLSTAGPFARHGSELVAACVRHGTHYVDITGETPWVRRMIDEHHDAAAARGTRIVPGCGFDSVPSDLGAWLVASALREQHGERCASVKACFSLRGGLNGGTAASLMDMLDTGAAGEFDNPFLLNPPGTAPADLSSHRDPLGALHDADFDAWLAPFAMGPINTRVVRRSAALLADAGLFADDFRYQEYLRIGRGPAAALAASGVAVGMASGRTALAIAPLREIAKRFVPAPGEGPSERTMDGGSFRCELIGVGERGTVVRGRIAGRGDPGNRATTVFVCESALALAVDAKKLPGGAKFGGVLTPSVAIGAVLAARLRAAGMTIEPIAPS